MDEKDNVRPPPLFSWYTITLVGGAIIWAANSSNWIDVAEFLKDVLVGWRNAFRAVWSLVLARIHLPFEVYDYQKDVLSLIGFLLGGAAFRILTGLRPQPFFYPSIGSKFERARERFGGAAGLIALLLMSLFAGAVVVAVLAPFVDTIAFTHDFWALGIPLYAVYMARQLYKTLGSFVSELVKAIHEGKFFRWAYDSVIKPVALSVLITSAFIGMPLGFNYLFGDVQLWNPIGLIPVDPEPFDPREYYTHLDRLKIVDMSLLGATLLALFLSAGRSLRPLVQFLILGGGILLFGWVSKLIIDAYPGVFSS